MLDIPAPECTQAAAVVTSLLTGTTRLLAGLGLASASEAAWRRVEMHTGQADVATVGGN
jgi:hypothetical protein